MNIKKIMFQNQHYLSFAYVILLKYDNDDNLK